jgi:hypothetical protein
MKSSTIKKQLERFVQEIKDNGVIYTNDGTKKNEIAYSQSWLISNTPAIFKGNKWEANVIPDHITEDMVEDAISWLNMY